MSEEEKFLEAVKNLKGSDKKPKFDESVDLIVNLKNFDVRRESLNIFVQVPHKIKTKKIAGFLEKESSVIDTIKKEDFARYKEKKDMKRLVRHYDFFMANAKIMPAIATSFGRVLGPAGKMPSPQLGIIMDEGEKNIREIIEKINSTIRIKTKEPSIKLCVGKSSMKEEQIVENIITVYHKIIDNLPRKKDNIKSVLVKLTMDKPIKVEI